MRITRTAPLASSCTSTAGWRTIPRRTETTCDLPALRLMTSRSGPRWGACRAASAVSMWPRTRSPSTASEQIAAAQPGARRGRVRHDADDSQQRLALRAHAHADAVEPGAVSALSAAYSADVR